LLAVRFHTTTLLKAPHFNRFLHIAVPIIPKPRKPTLGALGEPVAASVTMVTDGFKNASVIET
jgi:hypothetical protein